MRGFSLLLALRAGPGRDLVSATARGAAEPFDRPRSAAEISSGTTGVGSRSMQPTETGRGAEMTTAATDFGHLEPMLDAAGRAARRRRHRGPVTGAGRRRATGWPCVTRA